MSVPAGLAPEDGLPVGLQVLAPALADDRLYRVGAALEALLEQQWGGPLLDPRQAGGGAMTDVPELRPSTTRSRALRPGDRARGARRAEHRDEDVLRLPGDASAPSRTRRSARPASGLPGSLPVVNAMAVESAIRIGLALNCEIAEWCRFARKNYFYPDMPKNFQTSQYDEPIAFDGWTDVEVRRRRRDLPRRDRARPHGGGHRQVDARRRRDRPHPRRRLLAGRLQPRRHPAHRDRHQADHGRRRAGARGGAGLRRRPA